MSGRQRAIIDAYDAARAAWPGVELSRDAFERWIEARGDPAELNTSDLYLACACALGVPSALAAFEERVLPAVDGAVARAGGARVAAEVKQRVREKLFVGTADKAARIASFSGRGALVTWVRVVAVRTATTMLRGEAREEPLEAAMADTPGVMDSPELLHLRRRYAHDFKAAFEVAVAALAPRERNLLRQHMIDGLTIDDLGALYRVNRVTAARWLTRARDEVADATRRELAGRLRLGGEELESVMRLVRSELDLSLERVLRRA